jgi:hypothetical protein
MIHFTKKAEVEYIMRMLDVFQFRTFSVPTLSNNVKITVLFVISQFYQYIVCMKSNVMITDNQGIGRGSRGLIEIVPGIFLEKLSITMLVSQNIWCIGRDSNPVFIL